MIALTIEAKWSTRTDSFLFIFKNFSIIISTFFGMVLNGKKKRFDNRSICFMKKAQKWISVNQLLFCSHWTPTSGWPKTVFCFIKKQANHNSIGFIPCVLQYIMDRYASVCVCAFCMRVITGIEYMVSGHSHKVYLHSGFVFVFLKHYFMHHT